MLGGLVLIAATVFWATPALVEGRIGAEMRARMPEEAVSWDRIEWNWNNTFAVSGLRYERGRFSVSVDALRGSVDIRDLTAGDYDISFKGTARLTAPESVRIQRAWQFYGDVSTGDRRGRFRLTPTEGVEVGGRSRESRPPTLIAEAAGIVGVFRLPSDAVPWGVEARFRQGRIQVAAASKGFLKARAAAIDVSAGGSMAPLVSTDEFEVDLHPAEPEFGDVLAATSSKEHGSDRVGDSAVSMTRRLLTHVKDLRLRATGGTIRRGGQKGDASSVLVDELSVEKVGTEVGVRGGVFNGTVAMRADVSPARLRPARASIVATGIELHELPAEWIPVGSVAGRMSLKAVGVSSPMPGPEGPEESGVFRAKLDDLVVAADGLSERALPLGSVSLSAHWSRHSELGRSRISDGRLNYDGLEFDFRGSRVESPGGPVLTGAASVERLECQPAVKGLPRRLLGPYRDVELEGTASPRFSFEYPVDAPERLTIDLNGFPGDCRVEALHADPRAWPDIRIGTSQPEAGPESDEVGGAPEAAELEAVPASWSPRSPDDVFWLKTPFILPVDEGVSAGADIEVGPGLPGYVPLSSMPEYVGGAAYLSEEVNFYDDGAWNLHLIQRALRMNLSEGRFVYGGSTVTQQLVKNLFLTRDKTIARKVQEALIAWRMQEVVSKDRVLELYLNCIEYGEDLYGIGPAARRYFNREASELTVLQAVFLATIKPAPWYGDRFFKRGQTPERGWWPERIEEITRRLHKHGYISEQQLQAAEPFVVTFPTP